MCEPLFQIGRTPIKPLDLNLSQPDRRIQDRRVNDRAFDPQDVLDRAHKQWSDQRSGVDRRKQVQQ